MNEIYTMRSSKDYINKENKISSANFLISVFPVTRRNIGSLPNRLSHLVSYSFR